MTTTEGIVIYWFLISSYISNQRIDWVDVRGKHLTCFNVLNFSWVSVAKKANLLSNYLLEQEKPLGLNPAVSTFALSCKCIQNDTEQKQHFFIFLPVHPAKSTCFLKLWRAAYPIHKGHRPCISEQHRNITAFLPSVWPAVFVQFSSHGGLRVCHPYLLWPGHCLQSNL